MIEVKTVRTPEQPTHDDIVGWLQQMDAACIRTNGKDFLDAAEHIEQTFDMLITQNEMLMERLRRIEEIRFQNG